MALIINLILNRDTLLRKKNGSEILENEYKTVNRYRQFLFAATLYFISDIAWGFLYENRYISIVFTLLYLDTVLYFLLIYLTMLTWIRYIVAYLNKRGRKSKSLLYAAWIMFLLALIQLTVNFFYPFIFSFNENHDYVAEIGRHIAFFFHVALYIVTSTYMLIIAHKSAGNEKRRYTAVGFTCLVMELFAILQIFDAEYPSYALGLIIGISVIHSFVEAGERKEKEIYDNIAKSLSDNYEVIYYIDIKTDEFLEFSRSNEYASMNIPVEGQNFYKETLLNIEKYVHPDDKEFAKKMYSRETIFEKLKDKKSYSYKYRVMIYGHSRHIQFTVMFAKDKKHFILYEKDIEDEITAENMRLENQKMQITFTQIAEILAVNYDMIYYVDADNSNYISFESRNIYGYLKIQKSGDDFFTDSKLNISKIVHKNDQNLVLDFINKDYLNAHLLNQKNCHLNYRINTSKQTHFIRLTVQKTADGTHYIFLMENIDEEIQREKQHLKALNTEKELARRDELTGVKNKTAYTEMEKSVQANIDNGLDYLPFALVVCDTNGLKKINDTQGHAAGNEYIKKSANLLCNIFVHSPVFRIGGDEFLVFLRANDYTNREELMNKLQNQVLENIKTGTGPSLASGMAEYIPEKDTLVTEIFDRADKEMYKNKKLIKQRNK